MPLLNTAVLTVLNKFKMFSESLAGQEPNPVMENLDGDQKFLQDEPVPNVTYPGDICCTFYENQYFGGQTHTSCISESETEHVVNGHAWNFGGWTSSFECGKSVAYEMESTEKGGTWEFIMTGAGHIRVAEMDLAFDNKIGKLTLRHYDMWKTGSVTVWS